MCFVIRHNKAANNPCKNQRLCPNQRPTKIDEAVKAGRPQLSALMTIFDTQMEALLAGSDVAPSEWTEYYSTMQPQVFVRARPRAARLRAAPRRALGRAAALTAFTRRLAARAPGLQAHDHCEDGAMPELIHNTSPAHLVELSLKYESSSSSLTSTGALACLSGAKTGRSPKDKRIVEHPSSSDNVWWGPVNIKLSQQAFMINRERAVDYLRTRDRLFVIDAFAGHDTQYRVKIRVICSRACASPAPAPTARARARAATLRPSARARAR